MGKQNEAYKHVNIIYYIPYTLKQVLLIISISISISSRITLVLLLVTAIIVSSIKSSTINSMLCFYFYFLTTTIYMY